MRPSREFPRSPRSFATASLALAILGLLTILAPSAAQAASYTVKVCTPTSLGGDGVTHTAEGAISLAYFPCGNSRFESISLVGVGTMKGAQSWTLAAPKGAEISKLTAEIDFAPEPAWASGVQWELHSGADANGERLDSARAGAIPVNGPITFFPSSESLTSRMFCPQAECKGGEPLVRVGDVFAEVVDLSPPSATLMAQGPVHGAASLPYRAEDFGAGIASVALVVDGQEQQTIADDNEGRCQKPYKLMMPCKPALSGTLAFESTNFKDGAHQVGVAVEDGAGLRSVSAPQTVIVHNAPTNSERPSLFGTAKARGQLASTTGRWEGSPTAFAYQWLRCQATAKVGEEAGCTPIAAATQSHYTPVEADAGKRLLAKVTAANAFGSEATLSALSEPVAAEAQAAMDPILSAVSLSRARFRVGKARTSPAAAPTSPRGTVLRFSSSETGKLSAAISPAGKKVAKPLATLTRMIGAGRGHFAFSGRIGHKPLRPGRYVLSVTATDAAGNVSKAARLPFTVLRG